MKKKAGMEAIIGTMVESRGPDPTAEEMSESGRAADGGWHGCLAVIVDGEVRIGGLQGLKVIWAGIKAFSSAFGVPI